MYNQENFDKNDPDVVGKYDIPAINAVASAPKVDHWAGFREKIATPANTGLHFFIDDYRFADVWRHPDRYVTRLREFAAVLSPDFSMYTDMPLALQIYNHYRKQWLAAYWQRLGVNVIPTISWSDARSFEFCFDGVPQRSVVAVSSVGCMVRKDAKKGFEAGFEEMMKRLQPSVVLYYGKQHTDIPQIISMGDTFYSKFDKKPEVKENGR